MKLLSISYLTQISSLVNVRQNEANSLDQIKMTENWLEYDQKIFTTTNLIFWTCLKFMTPTNINFTPKKYAGAVSLDKSPNHGLQACTGWDTCPASLCSSTRKKHQALRLGGPRT